MTHTVLARKYRPKCFSGLVGQNTTVKILQNIILSKRLHHAYLLTGTRGVGKTTIARIIAKAVNCTNLNQSEPCLNCESCLSIDTGRFVDVIEIDAASNTGVDNIREVIENAQYTPTSGQYKVYIIDEVHMLSKAAFNAMLKTLEEPPAHIIFILATTDLHKVPITILSRCLQLKLRNLTEDEIALYLAKILNLEQISFEPLALEILAHAANGSMRDALSLTDQALAFTNNTINAKLCHEMLGIGDSTTIFSLINAIIDNDVQTISHLSHELYVNGMNLYNVLEQINQIFFEITLAQLNLPKYKDSPIAQLANKISPNNCQLFFEISNLGLNQMQKQDNHYPIFSMCLLRMHTFKLANSQERQAVLNNSNHNLASLENIQENASNTNQILQTPIVTNNSELGKTAEKNKMNTLEPLSAAKFDWLEFVCKQNSKQLNTNISVILRNASLAEDLSNNELSLNIPDHYRNLVNKDAVDLIKSMLLKEYNQHFNLNFNFSLEDDLKSFKNAQIANNKALQTEAEHSIYQDPIIQDLINNFSAKILPNSIKPLKG